MFLFPGAEVNAVSYQSQTVLHKLYCHNEQPVLDVYEKTKLFLALGKLFGLSSLGAKMLATKIPLAGGSLCED